MGNEKHQFNIGTNLQRETHEVREPTKSKWYCAFHWHSEMESYYDDLLAEYVGNGVFLDDNGSDVSDAMLDAEFLVEQK